MPVLYGVFLYMGVSSLNGVQLMQRISIVLMPPKYQPDYIYLRHVPLRRVHLFTAIQVSGSNPSRFPNLYLGLNVKPNFSHRFYDLSSYPVALTSKKNLSVK